MECIDINIIDTNMNNMNNMNNANFQVLELLDALSDEKISLDDAIELLKTPYSIDTILFLKKFNLNNK